MRNVTIEQAIQLGRVDNFWAGCALWATATGL
jgi:hypothetical protein